MNSSVRTSCRSGPVGLVQWRYVVLPPKIAHWDGRSTSRPLPRISRWVSGCRSMALWLVASGFQPHSVACKRVCLGNSVFQPSMYHWNIPF